MQLMNINSLSLIQNKQYADEVRERWGDTEAYKENERRAANYSQSDWDALYDGMNP